MVRTTQATEANAEGVGAPAPPLSPAAPPDSFYRAVTFPATDEWAVLDPYGDVLFRGDAIYAARVANELNGS